MKILLVNLPWRRGKYWGVRAGSRWPHIKSAQEDNYCPFPFFLAYAAALLKREGFDVKLIDALAEKIPARLFLQRVLDERPDLIVAETSTTSLFNDLNILKKIPDEVLIALCGPDANIRDAGFLSGYKFVDYVFTGEYEHTLLELARRLQSKKGLGDTLGLIFRENGSLKINPMRPLLEDLDSLPWPLREGLPMARYNDNPGGIPVPSVQMWGSRGCPYQCLFCLWPQLMYQKNRYRVRNIVRVADEMEYLVKTMGFKSVYFDDDTANIGKLRMLQFSKELKRRNLNVPWAMMARPDLMDEEILESLRSAGLYAVKYGLESGDQRLLDNINKNMDVRRAERMIRFTRSLGIKTHLTVTFGLPGETSETVKNTLGFVLDLDPDSVQFSITTAFPGTKYFRDREDKGHIVSYEFSDYDGNSKSMLRTEALSHRELEKARENAIKAWQAHLWHTRYRHLNASGYFRKALAALKNNNLGIGLLKGALFINDRVKRVGIKRLSVILNERKRRINNDFLKAKSSFINNGAVHTLRRLTNNYLDILGVLNGEHAFKGPNCVQIDLTNNCNNNCIGCWCNSPLLGERAYKGLRKLETLPLYLVESLIDELAFLGTGELYFSGGGEPFMHPDLISILEYAKHRKMVCSVNTNFTLVDENTVRKIIDLKLDHLTVSVWAGTAQTYVATHPNKDEATYYKIKSLLKMMNSLKEKRPFVKVYNVISNMNYHELEKMVDFAAETNCEAVEFTVIDTIPDATDMLILSKEERMLVIEQCERIKKNAAGKVKVLNLEHFMRRVMDPGAENAQYDSKFIDTIPCYIGWLFSRVMPNGDVNFCLKAHRVPVGNLYEKPFVEIWNSCRQKEFRRAALKEIKDDAFFSLIGNDPNCKVGCYKSCDDMGRNLNMHDKISSLNPILRFMMHKAAKIGG